MALKNQFPFLALFLFFIPSACALDTIPVQPSQGQVFNITNNVTFTCNASDESQVLNMSLYHNLNGTFSMNQTEYYGELPLDSNTSFLCHFNGGLECQAGGSGNPVANDSLSLVEGKFSYGVNINETGILRYQTSGNFDRSQGTIEFWISPGSDVSSYSGYVFHFADNNMIDENEMFLAIYSGTLHFEIKDSYGYGYYSNHDISGWIPGEWYHIAAAWDLDSNVTENEEDLMAIYVNGSTEDSSYSCDYSCDPPISLFYSPQSFSIGSDKYNSSRINATIDDFRISSSVRSASEINQTYYEGLLNRSSVSRSWPFFNVPDGSYLWSCLAYDNDSQANSSSVMNFYMDMSTQPSVNTIHLSPNSSDDIDPGVSINFTANVTDPSGVDTVIFQYKEAEEGSWNNITMAYNASGGLYENATFQTIPNDMGVYYYRIWSNDSKGSAGYSPTQNLTSAVDFTWARSPASFGTASGLISSVSNVGILAINNTGDRTLNFSISDNWPLYYNGSDSSNFYVANHTAITVNITAEFASSDSENDITITVNASHYSNPPSLSPVSLTTNATINSYSGGPYLSVSIMEYSGMVSQSQTFNLSARVKNIGNETAEDAWLNWSLPEGWSNATGNLSQFLGNMTSGSFAWNNITVIVSPSSASPGTFLIYANSSCSQNASGQDSETVGVSCSDSDGVCGYGCSYVNDQDCGIPSSPAGGTAQPVYAGGGGESFNYAMAAEAAAVFDMNREERKSLAVKISNTGKRSALGGIYIDVIGYPLTHVKMSPQTITRLEAGQSAVFELEFFAPGYMTYGVHNITISIVATGSSNFTRNLTRVERILGVSVVVHSARENETLELAERVKEALLGMESLGLGTGKVSSLLEKAEAQISGWDYDTAMNNLKAALEARDKTVQIMGLIGSTEGNVREADIYGVQTPETRKMNELSKAALAREDYAKAEERANSALAAYAMEARMIGAMKFFHAYWQALLGAFSLSLAAGYLGRRRTLRNRVLRRIDYFSGQERALRKMEEKAKEDYYRKGEISSREYHSLMGMYGTGLAKARRRKSGLIGKLASVKGKSAEEAFRERERYARKEIEDSQRRYFEQGAISRSAYDKGVKELTEELADALQSIETIERRRNKRQKLAAANFQPSTPSGQKVEERRKVKGTCRILPIFAVAVLLAFSHIAMAQDSGMKVAEPLSSQNERMKVTLSPSSQGERQAALDAMGKAEYIIGEMESLGLPASRANDTLNEAGLLFSKGFYIGAESLAREVESIKSTAISLGSRADGLESYMYEVSLEADVSEAKEIFEEGLDALEQEQYEKAEELFSQVQARLEEMQSRASLERAMEAGTWENTLSLLRTNILLIVISAIVLASAAVLGARLRKGRRAARRKASLLQEKERISGSMKEIQTRYFGQGKISRQEYEAMMGRCRKRLAGIGREILAMEPHKAEKPIGREKAGQKAKERK